VGTCTLAILEKRRRRRGVGGRESFMRTSTN